MEMRDFFLYASLAAGPALFGRDGWLPVQAKGAAALAWRAPAEAAGSAWERWATGRTAPPQVTRARLGAARAAWDARPLPYTRRQSTLDTEGRG